MGSAVKKYFFTVKSTLLFKFLLNNSTSWRLRKQISFAIEEKGTVKREIWNEKESQARFNGVKWTVFEFSFYFFLKNHVGWAMYLKISLEYYFILNILIYIKN